MFSAVTQSRSFADIVIDEYNAHPDERYIGLYQFLTPTLMIRDLELIKKIAVKEFDTFPDHKLFTPETADPISNRNLFALRGSTGEWHDMKSVLTPAFTSSKLKKMVVLVEQCAEQFVTYLEKQEGVIEVEIKDVFSRYTADVIGSNAFGIACDSFADRENLFYLMVKKMTSFTKIQTLKLFGFLLIPTLMLLMKFKILDEEDTDFFRSLVIEAIKVREETKITRPDIISLLTEAKRGRLNHDRLESNAMNSEFAAEKRKRIEITDDDIAAQAVLFIFAGYDTISTVLCYMSYELARNPVIQETLHKEIEENCLDGITYETVVGMKYLDCVVSETLRRWTPGAVIDRFSVKPFTIEPENPGEKPVHLEAGSFIWLPVIAIHRDPKYYPDPQKFNPDRFSDENKKNIKPFSYLPFGAGPRTCLGQRFALLEMKLLMIKILQKFEIVPVDKTPNSIVYGKCTFSPYPDDGIWLGFKSRKYCY
ncbi:hypothetical protein ILUMI_06752 [Ignelater luminosus]|uniref:Cytochrome P450 n=1 Tax=Ignelater luminosus TaxID=2038154 RepID=A0A8K0D4T1_IGNLU|nr:hypothetical protein ILUMI_06752 [Ignelater luminosus]